MTRNCSDRSSDRSFVFLAGRKRLKLLAGGMVAVVLCVAIRYYWGASPASAQTAEDRPARAARSAQSKAAASDDSFEAKMQASVQAAKDSGKAVVATVNNQRITRDQLARQCRRVYGKEVLESMLNKQLIVEACRRQGVEVTRAEVDAEIQRMAKRFGIPLDQWLKLLKQERNLTPEQYADDIIWPNLALRKLAGGSLTITHEEMVKEFETVYGEAIRARLIAVSSLEKAKSLQAQAAAKPEEFGNLAKDYSEDAPSASAKGMINPIRKHGSYKEIEEAVFNMPDGAVSPVIHAGGQYLILKREGVLPARPVSFEQAAPKIEETLRERKMRDVAPEIFLQLQKETKIENVWNDPAKHKQMPQVAALVNGSPISIQELDEECIARHGLETLDGMISRAIVEQECRRKSAEVTEADLDAEIAQAALAGVRPRSDGSPDVEAWLKLVAEKQSISAEVYRNDVAWFAAALKKLVGDEIRISDEDLHKGYEANFGPRVRCLAIVLSNQRIAQQVFEMARNNNTPEYFGELAAQYSVEPGSQAMHGEVPPIKRHGGQPQLEEEAFSLKPGELSGVIQVGDKFVILRCEGYTDPAKVSFERVRDDIYEDLREKKLRMAMAERFEELEGAATVDNYLAGTSRAPKQGGVATAPKAPALRQVPGR